MKKHAFVIAALVLCCCSATAAAPPPDAPPVYVEAPFQPAQVAPAPTPTEPTAREIDAFNANLRQLGDSCDDLTAIEHMAATSQWPSLADHARDEAVKRRKRATAEHMVQIDSQMRRNQTNPRELEGLADARHQVAEVRDHVIDLGCYDATTAQNLGARVDDWATKREERLTAEETCRASPDCLERREAEPICKKIAEKKQSAADLQREHQNPSGVVNLAVLHDLGEQMQNADSVLRKLKKDFAEEQHHAFTEKLCAKTAGVH